MNRKEFTIIAIIIFLSVVAWITFDFFRAKNSTIITQTELKRVVPLTPTFDTDTIDKLKGREE